MLDKKSIYVAILNQGWIRAELVYAITQLISQGKYNLIIDYPAGKPIESNRNKIVKKFLETDFDYLMMIDSDIVPPLSVLSLADYQFDVIGGLCYAFRESAIVPLILKQKEDGDYGIQDVDDDAGVVEADAVGTGCMVIKREVLENPKMKYPFKNYYDEDGIRNFGLDLSFCKRAQQEGFKIFTNTFYRCSHWNPMDLKLLYGTITQLGKEGKQNDSSATNQGQK